MTDESLGTFINPFTDFGFKKLFGSEELVSFDEISNEFQGDIIEEAFQLAKLANMSYEDRHAYELSLKYYRDFINVIDTAKKEAKEQGRLEEKLEIANAMLTKGFDMQTVIEITGLTEEIILQ